jgi:hypothetical protein
VKRIATFLVAAGIAASAAATSAAAPAFSAAQYRSQVNALCRSYTPKLKQVEVDMAHARSSGDSQRYAYDIGVLAGVSLVEGARMERTPLPRTGAAPFATPLHLLHTVDARLRLLVTHALAANMAAVVADMNVLGKVAAPLNRSFDAAGLRDCGSNQS